jgi:hypothetical protein
MMRLVEYFYEAIPQIIKNIEQNYNKPFIKNCE